MLNDYSLEGMVAIVTGGGQGIGEGIALTLAEAGADIIVAARTLEQLEQVALKIRCLGRKCLPIPTDVTSEGQVENMVQTTISEFGKINILVNSAGMNMVKPILVPPGFQSKMSRLVPDFYSPMTAEQWRKLIDVNLTGVFICCKAGFEAVEIL